MAEQPQIKQEQIKLEQIKPEEIKPEQIKPDPDAGSPFMDEALDEENPDLEFYDKLPDADAYSRMYLARLPNYVWEAWSKLDDDAEIEIGTVRQWSDKDGNLVSRFVAETTSPCG
jgi:transcription initiation factor TFIIF subunit beta